MTRRICALVIINAVAGMAQTKWPNALRTWFPDGTALRIHTESTGTNSPLSTSGSVVVGAGHDVHRMVLDSKGAALFAYDIEARKTSTGTYALRIKPIDEAKIRLESWFPKDKFKERIPTMTALRDFPPLRAGDEVQVDILFHPGTGEKIFDVVRIVTDPPPASKPAPSNQFSFQSVRVTIAGKVVQEPANNWIIGAAAAIVLPGRGTFYLALDPSTEFALQPGGWVDRNVLRFHAGADLVEVTGKSNLLQKSDFGTIWVYNDLDLFSRGALTDRLARLSARQDQLRLTYRTDHPDMKALDQQITALRQMLERLEQMKESKARAFEIRTADTVEMLIPKKQNDE